MRIIKRDELLKCPIGTIFTEYNETVETEVIMDRLRILTNVSKEEEPFMCREVYLVPSLQYTDRGEQEREAHWVAYDIAGDIGEYQQDDQFVVFNRMEIVKMIELLVWALIGCEAPEDMDVDFLTDEFNPSSVVTPQED